MNQRDDSSYELISAYLDGELTPDERARVEQLVASSHEHQQTLDEMRAVAGGMKVLPEYRLDEAFPQRVIAAARAAGVALGGDTSRELRPARARSATHVWHWPAALAVFTTAAAAVAALLVWSPFDDGLTPSSQQLVSQANPRDGDIPIEPAPSLPTDLPNRSAALRDHAKLGDPAAAARAADRAEEKHETLPAAASADAMPGAAESAVPGGPEPSHVALSPPGPVANMVDPSGVVSRVPANADNRTDRPRGPDQLRLERDDRMPGRAPVDVPFSGTHQVMLVIDVALTRQGLDKGAFEQALAAHGVAVEGTVPVDARLEASLLATRFFEPSKAAPENDVAVKTDLTLMYVKTLAGHVDEIWRAMRSDQSQFAAVTLDMAFLTADQTMFHELRRAVDQQAVQQPPVAADENRARRAAGHRLALSPSWRGSPVTKLQGLEDLAGAVPDWMLGKDTGKKEPVPDIPGQPAARDALPPGGALGANVDAEVLFVVHVGRTGQE